MLRFYLNKALLNNIHSRKNIFVLLNFAYIFVWLHSTETFPEKKMNECQN